MEPLKIEYWPIVRLIPYARNPRRNDAAVPRLASMIKEFGFRVPVVARSDGEVVDGHLRLKAAQALGMQTVPVVLADDWTPQQVKAFRVAVNKAAELAEWDEELLRLELEELQADGFDLGLTGLDTAEVDALVGADVQPLDEMPALPEGEKQSLAGMSFTLSAEQAETVRAALKTAKKQAGGAFEGTGNENSNGNALAFICEAFLGRHG